MVLFPCLCNCSLHLGDGIGVWHNIGLPEITKGGWGNRWCVTCKE